MRFAMIMTIGVLVGSAHVQPGWVLGHQKINETAAACPLFGPPTAFGQFLDLRVDGDNGSPTGDGSGWGLDAYKYLQDALVDAADAPPGTTVRLLVAATDPSNPYRPDRDAANPNGTGDRDSTFLLNFSDVQLLGGFPPGGGDLADRDPALYETVLSGVLLQSQCATANAGDCFEANGTPGCEDAACCEIVCAALPQCCNDQWDQACADFANLVCGVCGEPGSGSCFEPNGTPGCEDGNCCALVCDEDPICCILPWDQLCAASAVNICLPDPPKAYHVVTANGVDDTVRIDGFTITDGLADGPPGNDRLGAGMLILNASPAVVHVTFTENSAPGHGGGAMHIGGTAHPLVVNCSMTTNDGSFGGAIHIDAAPASATLVNCRISGNTATVSGGGIDARSSFPATLDLINCTVTDNTAPSSGGGIWVAGTMEVTITNSILWRNVPDQINGVATVTYSDVEGDWPGEGNINLDPFFVDPGNGDYRLSPGSPCIDAADNTAVQKGDDTDLDGDPRFIEDPNTPDTGLSDCPIVDMGSYEFQDGMTDCCPGDLDGSGSVGVKDLLFLLGAWGPCPKKGDCPADFDNSNDVGVKDLLILLGNWGPCP